MRLGLALVFLAALAAVFFWETEQPFGTYRPAIRPVGWTADGALYYVHQEAQGGYDYRNFSCGDSGLYALSGDAGPRPVLRGAEWCRLFPFSMDERALRLSWDGATIRAAGALRHGDDCGSTAALDIGQRRMRELHRICTSHLADAAVSPDGRWVVGHLSCSEQFGGGEPPKVLPAGCVDRDARLSLIPLNGGAVRSIGGEKLREPVWSPDGRSLLAVSEENWEIVHLDVATGAQRVVAKGGDAAWSPDGRWIAFTRSDSEGEKWIVSLRIIRVDGTGERVLFVQPEGWIPSMETRANGMPHSPLWSPDGRRIVFVRRHNRGETLWSINADGTGMRRLTRPIPKA